MKIVIFWTRPGNAIIVKLAFQAIKSLSFSFPVILLHTGQQEETDRLNVLKLDWTRTYDWNLEAPDAVEQLFPEVE